MKKIWALILTLSLTASMGLQSFAAENQQNSDEGILSEYGVTAQEIEDLEKNLDAAFEKLDKINMAQRNATSMEETEVRISENLVLVSGINQTKGIAQSRNRATVYETKIQGWVQMRNNLGMTILTLYSNGVFWYDGQYSTPIDAYGDYSSVVWDVEVTGSAKGSKASKTWARNSFSGQLYIGIDPIGMEIQSFSRSGTVYCDKNGNASQSWSNANWG